MSNVVADHLVLLDHLRSILVAVGEAEQVPEESHVLFLERFDELRALLPIDPIESQYLGQDMMSQVILRYPQIAHLVPRDLLWFFGGDCLHFMPDDELDMYQALEERRFEAEQNDEPFDWNQENSCWPCPTTSPSTDPESTGYQMWKRACVGAGLLAKAVNQSLDVLNDTPYSRASPLPHTPLPYCFRPHCSYGLRNVGSFAMHSTR